MAKRLLCGLSVAVAMASAIAGKHAQGQDASTAMKFITETANNFCTTPSLIQTHNEYELTATAKAMLDGILKKFASLGFEGAAKYTSGQSEGVLQKDLAGAIANGNDCKLGVLQTLLPKVAPQALVPTTHISKTFHAYGSGPKDVYPIVGQARETWIIISGVTLVVDDFNGHYTYSLDYDFYTVGWARDKKVNMYIDFMNDQGGAIPGQQLTAAVDDGHCTRTPKGAEHAHEFNYLNGYPPDLLATTKEIRLRSDQINYKIGKC